MKMVMIAALAAASPAQAAERPSEEALTQERAASAGARLQEDVELNLRDVQATEARGGNASASPIAATAQEDEPKKKRKSTGDKVLTGAAVILGISAVAVGGLLVAIFVG